MTRLEFLTRLSERGYSRDEAASALTQWRDAGRAFDDEAQQKKEPVAQASEQKPAGKSAFEAMYPRTKEALADVESGQYKNKYAAVPRVTGALLSDNLSAAGRAVASLPALMPGGETFSEAMSRPRGKERQGLGNVAQIAGDIVRSPATAVGGVFGGLARGVAKKAIGGGLGKVGGAVAANVAEGVAYLAGRQLERVGEGQGLSPGEAGLDVAEDVVMPLGGMAAKKVIGGAAEKVVHQFTKQIDEKVDEAIKKAVSKGIKPTVIGKPTIGKLDEFYDNAAKAVRIISKNKKSIALVDDAGETVARPRNTREFAEAIDQTKKIIYKQYHEMAEQAGEAGARFNIKPIAGELETLADASNPKMKGFPKTRTYAASLAEEIKELDGAAPEIVEAKIKELNGNLKAFFAGRTDKIQAQVDTSIAARLREQLDKQITDAVGPGYQPLKKEYGALKAIENEVAKRALVNARKSTKGLIDFTDIFTGADLAAGIITMNPALIARGAAGKGIQTAIKSALDPERTIDKMFKAAYDEVDRLGIEPLTAPAAKQINFDAPAFARKGVPVEKQIAGESAERAATAAANEAERAALKASNEIGRQDLVKAVRDMQASGKPENEIIAAIKKLQSNQRGSIGGDIISSTRFGKLTPAIKSPESGKIYTGHSHKDIFKSQITRQEPGAENKVWQAIFDDNTGKGSPIVGFVDKNGDFVSRIDAEKEIENLTNVSAMRGNTALPMLAAGAGLSGGALAASGALNRPKQKEPEKPYRSSMYADYEQSDKFNEMLAGLSDKELNIVADVIDKRLKGNSKEQNKASSSISRSAAKKISKTILDELEEN